MNTDDRAAFLEEFDENEKDACFDRALTRVVAAFPIGIDATPDEVLKTALVRAFVEEWYGYLVAKGEIIDLGNGMYRKASAAT